MSVSSINHTIDGIILASSSSSISTILSLLNPPLINNTIHIVLAFSSFFSVSVSLFSLHCHGHEPDQTNMVRTHRKQQLEGPPRPSPPRPSKTHPSLRRLHTSHLRCLQQRPKLQVLWFKPLREVLFLPKGHARERFRLQSSLLSLWKAFLLHSLSRESWDRESNWIGYIAVNSDEVASASGRREIYVVWRGTTRDYEWINVFGAAPVSAKALLSAETIKEISSSNDDDEDENEEMPKVMAGWLTIYTSDNPDSPFSKTSARTQVLKKVNELLKLYKDENPTVVISGHSLGASLSILSAFDLVENGVKNVPVTAIIFGSPQVGNKAFNERVKKFTNLKVLHIRNVIDLLTLYPGGLLGYVDTTGTELRIDTRKSPSLKESKNPGDWHNLQAMLHVVAGWNGADGEFEMKVKRSLALVNKSCEFLKDEYLVPGSWWVEKNKSMVRRDDGEWVLASPDEEDLPVPED